ncbi:MAG: AAA family ATPase [Candidatus Colwellbacteria bacterium]|nr:AAA family ATPase [Candidatus Colwellbacteria bacterium]
MFLKRLELQGFKSFADKISLDLTSGVTAIVGPNGSGKSNIIDAVRWLLGERDARQLRGGKSEDLIFAGTQMRARVGLAQASFVFDNHSGVFPLDFKEVVISRRLGRDGLTHFFLNKSEVRLKDIAELLAKIKVGPRGLAVVNQGESDIFVKANPLERRTMIEEILGLKEYEIKKDEASRRLENTFSNLEKIKLSLEEIKPHLRFLKKQASRYESREKLAEELRELENNFYGRRLETIRKGEKELASREAKLKEQITRQEEVFTGAEAEMKKISAEGGSASGGGELQLKRSSILSEREKLQKELGRFEARLEFEAKSGESETDFLKIINEVRRVAKNLLDEKDPAKLKDGLQQILNLLDNKGDLLDKADKKLTKEIESITKNLNNLDQALRELVREEEKARGTITSFNERFKSAYALVESERKKLEALKEEENHLIIGRERLVSRQTALHEELLQIGRSIEELEIRREELGAAPIVEEQVLKLMLKLRGELASIGEVDEVLIEEAKETEERYNFLSAESVDLERAMADLKKLIRDLEEKINKEFDSAIKLINQEFNKLVSLMFGGGKAKLTIQNVEDVGVVGDEDGEQVQQAERSNNSNIPGVEIDLSLPRKKIKGLDVLSGGERSLVSIAALFALISVSSPPFLVLDEIDVALDEKNAKRFGEMLKDLSAKTQFIVVTHNRATMEVADVLYGVTMAPDGTSKLVSLKLS